MIIIHESLPEEAAIIAKAFKQVFGLKSRLVEYDIEEAFEYIPEFDGYFIFNKPLPEKLCSRFRAYQKALLLTPRDIYVNSKSKEDDWAFACQAVNLTMVSTSRIKRSDNKPSQKLEIPLELYAKRLTALAIHEVGHEVVKAGHEEMYWVNAKTGYELLLGDHCRDNRCVMYAVVDLKSPPVEEGYLKIGDEKRYDAGLDDLIERLNPDFFCGKCKSEIKITKGYK